MRVTRSICGLNMVVYIAGRINIDIFIEIDDVLISGRKYKGKILFIDVGGTAANVATSIARINKNLRPKLLGAIGKDYAEFVCEKLGSEGIDLQDLVILDGETGKAYIFIDSNGESTIISVPGVNDMYNENYVPNRINDAKALVICNTTYSTALKLLNIAHLKNIPVFIDPHFLWTEIAKYIKKYSLKCFYLPNEYELHSFAKIDANNVNHIKNYAQQIGCSIIVKKGEKGAIAIHNNSIIKISALPLKYLGHRILSTAGCGDTFTGVFVAIYLKNHDIIEAIKYASIAAGIKATKLSSRAAPQLSEVIEVAEVVDRKGLLNVEVLNM